MSFLSADDAPERTGALEPGEHGAPERRIRVTDPRALRVLAHPLRLALLDRLMAFGEQTAAQCAAAVGSTASNCSYHLRALARAGLVAPGESADGREHPWRAAATGLEFGPAGAREPAAEALDALVMTREEELTREAVARHRTQPPAWQAAEAHHSYALRIAPEELERLVAEIDRLVRPYIALTRGPGPGGADAAYLRLHAFRHPQAP